MNCILSHLKRRTFSWAFVFVLGYGVWARWTFLREFPFGFGHPDTSQYGKTIIGLLRGEPLAPDPYRVCATYAYVASTWLKYVASSSFSLCILQSLMGIHASLIVFRFVVRLTSMRWLALGAFFLALVFPRGFLFEHIILAETLYVYLMLLTLDVAYRFVDRPGFTKALMLGLFTLGLILTRGQGWVGLLIAGYVWAWTVRNRRQTLVRAALTLVLIITPVAWGLSSYKAANLRVNNLNALSAIPDFNLYWITASRITDYSSDLHKDVKDILRPYYDRTQANYQGEEYWGIDADWSVVNIVFEHLGRDWSRFASTLGELGREAVRTHPLAYLYRLSWNFWQFLIKKRTMSDTIELQQLFVRMLPGGFMEIDPKLAADTRQHNPLEKESFPRRAFDPVIEFFFPVQAGSVAAPVSAASTMGTNRFIYHYKRLNDFRFWFLAVVLSTLGLFFVDRKLKPSVVGFGWLLILVFWAQAALSMIGLHALYDRTFIPQEFLAILILPVGLTALWRMSLRHKVWILGLIGFWAALLRPVYRWMYHLPFPYPLSIDKPILGLDPAIVVDHQKVVIAMLLCLGWVAASLVGLRYHLHKRQRGSHAE